jgi:hypothetical protein
MKIQALEAEDGKSFSADAPDVDEDFVERMRKLDMSDDKIMRMLDSLNISADAKQLLYQFSQVGIRVGKFILKIGRKILDFVCRIFEEFPNATFGMIFGAIAGALIASIPIIGFVLGPIFTPLAIIFGLAAGLKEDVKDKNLYRKIAEANSTFSPLNA